jgi:hypothetical protein
MVGGNICNSRIAISHPLTRRNRKISDYRVLTDAAKDDEQICKEKPVSEPSIIA